MSEKQEMAEGLGRGGEAAPLSPYRAFVVQFRTATEQALGGISQAGWSI